MSKTMQVYNLAHQLARELAQSEEYQQLIKARNKVMEVETARSMLEDFQKQQLEIQEAQLRGEEVPQEKVESIKKLYEIISAHPAIRDYRLAELRLVRVLGDIEKIIWDAVREALIVPPEIGK